MIYKHDKLTKSLRSEIDSYFNNNPSVCYKIWFKKKASGGRRQISEPELILKNIQKKIHSLFKEIELHKRFSKSCAGFMPNKSIGDNALVHSNYIFKSQKDISPFHNTIISKVYGKDAFFIGARVKLSEARALGMDLSDAFGSISKKMIKEGLREITSFSQEDIERIAKTCTLDGVLPQGASTSPDLQNVALNMFDNYLRASLHANITVKLKTNFHYSRFADDILISINKEGIIHKFIPIVESVAEYYDLQINRKKTKIMSLKHGIFVTGINIINSSTHLCVSRNYRNQVRSLIHKTAILEDKDSKKRLKNTQRIKGKILHVMSVDKAHGIKLFKYAVDRGILDGGEVINKTSLKEGIRFQKEVSEKRKKLYTNYKYDNKNNDNQYEHSLEQDSDGLWVL